MKKNIFIVAMLMAGFSNLALAESCFVTPKPVVPFSFGAAWPYGYHKRNLSCGCDIEKTYTQDDGTRVIGSGEVFVGGEWLLTPSFLAQFGLAAAALSNTKISGDILEIPDDYEFRSASYSYKLSHTRITAKISLSYETTYRNLSLYVDDSFGLGFNKASSYRLSDQECWAVNSPTFSSKTTQSFVNTVGIGIQMPFKNFRAAVGYEFDYLGKFALKSSSGENLSHKLYANMLKFTLSSA